MYAAAPPHFHNRTRFPAARKLLGERIWFRSQLTLASDAFVKIIDVPYLIFKLAIAFRQSLDDDIRSVRQVFRSMTNRKQVLADLEFVRDHDLRPPLRG